MFEKNPSETHDPMLVRSVSREQRSNLPPLIEDARNNPLFKYPTSEGDVLVKTVAYPYVPSHLLVIPDRADQTDMPGITDCPDELLNTTFRVAGSIAEYYLATKEDLNHVDIGFNYSPQENKKIIASQRRNLHIHVEAITETDKSRQVPLEEAMQQAEFRVQLEEPFRRVIEDITATQVTPRFLEDESCREMLIPSEPRYGKPTFVLPQGSASFADPQLVYALKKLHSFFSEADAALVDCYIQKDEAGSYREGTDGRYTPLPLEERAEKLEEYLENHPDLPLESVRHLRFLAVHLRGVEELVGEHGGVNEREVTDRFMAVKDFAYAATFSALKQDNDIQWVFAMDPIVFARRDTTQTSRAYPKLFERDPNEVYDQEKLELVKQEETGVREYLAAQ